MNVETRRLSVNRRQFLQLTGGTATLFLLSACGAVVAPAVPTPAGSALTPKRGGTLRIATPDDLTGFYPNRLGQSFTDVRVADMLYETLIRRAEAEEGVPLYPVLAESWEANEDATLYTFHLRQGVTFHHGTPFTAKDVEHTFNRLRDPAFQGVVSGLDAIDQLVVVDDFTVEFHLKSTNVTWPYNMGQQGLKIVPHDRTDEELAEEPAGTGPFVVAEWVQGERIVGKRNEKYWDPERPYLDELQMVILPEATTQIAALMSGSIELVQSVERENLALLEGAADVVVLECRQGLYPVFAMRVDQKPFDDVRVRQAVKHAVDRAGLVAAILQGRGSIGNDQPIDPGSPFWANVAPLAYDVEKAKALLAEAGYPEGLELTLHTSELMDGGPGVNAAAVALQEMLKAVGITLTIENVPGASYYAEAYLQVPFFTSWFPTFSEPDAILPLAYISTGAYNESGWGDPQVDEWVAAGRTELDLEKRKTIYAEIQQRISAEGGVLIPYFAPYLQAASTRLQGHFPGLRLVFRDLWLQ
jgi:peptide/nickel transport system substrate-binding protein